MRNVPAPHTAETSFLWTQGVAARETLAHLDRNGVDAGRLLAKAELSRDQLSRERGGASVASQCRFLELAAIETNDSLLGLRVAAAMDLRGIGLLFYLAASSATVAEALENLAQYAGTANEAVLVDISRRGADTVLTMRMMLPVDEPRRQFAEFITLAALRTLGSAANRDFFPSRITFAHARSSEVREVHRILRCPVEFSHPADSWVLPQSVMALPLVSSDSRLLELLETHADHLLSQRHRASGLVGMVESQLLAALPSGRVQAMAIARQLGMSQRSLTRGLAAEGTSFGKILDRLRNRLALRYLEDAKHFAPANRLAARLFGARRVQPRLQAMVRNLAPPNEKSAGFAGNGLNRSSAAPGFAPLIARHAALSTFWPELSSGHARQRPTSAACNEKPQTSISGSSRSWSRGSTPGAPGSGCRRAGPRPLPTCSIIFLTRTFPD